MAEDAVKLAAVASKITDYKLFNGIYSQKAFLL